jgi:hypothetical protein
LKGQYLDPIKPSAVTDNASSIKREISIGLLIEFAMKPLVEFNNMNRLAAALACFGFARLVGISNGDNQIPPPIPTIRVPRETPIGTPTTAIFLY